MDMHSSSKEALMRVNSISPIVYPVTKINKDKKQNFQQFVMAAQKSKRK
jgi:hypothetical protein